MSNHKIGAAIIGSGNIGSDLMIKILRHGRHLQLLALAGIDPASDGLARAQRLGVATTHEGIDGLVKLPEFKDIKIVFDATSAGAHIKHNAVLQQHGVRVIDLTPAAIGPYVVPVCNLNEHIQAANINMVTCGGQATIPIVHAINQISQVQYAEIVASIASNSAGPGTRANIDEFTETTAKALQSIGGANRAKAIIILNPAEPPVMMRDTVYCLLAEQGKEEAVREAVAARVAQVQQYVPGYRLKQTVQFENISAEEAGFYPDLQGRSGTKVTVFLEVEGAAHYLPAYAGNLDIMTSAALASAEIVAEQLASQGA
ncbi:MAG: acetaldehyde dehydrogenase (acetylating) [Neisseria sp.]|uniref:acetaldehyde dehydrogenase (acetylating) n=1 Tax=Neisseria sp. TaxID=192066 RepID=UPI0026DD50E9|nr:acetaldehyde dehydrogenase (acetylating) [Neisseria sp.]MDO4249029.1 acetaldehyde dehydrogenase (acetylating) [Neisseria sp.]